MKSLRTLHNRILDAVPGFEHFHPDFVISRALFSDVKKGRSYAQMYIIVSSAAHAVSVIAGLPFVDLPYVLPNTNRLLIKIEILVNINFVHTRLQTHSTCGTGTFRQGGFSLEIRQNVHRILRSYHTIKV